MKDLAQDLAEDVFGAAKDGSVEVLIAVPPPRCPWATREGRARKRRGAGRGGGCNAGRTTGRGAELVHRGPGGARPTCHATTAAAAAVFAQLALRWGMGAQLGSSVAFGSGCGQALPGVPRKAPLFL